MIFLRPSVPGKCWKYMQQEGVYIQWYDSIVDNGSISYQNAFNNRTWLD